FFNESPAVFFRKHDIDNKQIESAGPRCSQSSFAIESKINGETCFLQAFCQKSRRLLFVLDYQNSHERVILLMHSLSRRISMSESSRLGKTREHPNQETDLSRPGGSAITSPAIRNVVAAENKQ